MNSKFRDWQESREEISFDEFAKRHPIAAKFISSENYFDLDKIFVYRDGTWIAELGSDRVSQFLAYIQHEYCYNEYMEILEVRQYLYQYDRDE